ncbi:MAG: hypothetical protein CSB24_03335 [Deltaproteobacteria bacterium]|nr:MAG: hypothetical protein CSB24_03335 [Deltaproteobacteria bacterium]
MFIVLLLIGANIFYTSVEHWSTVDALYFSVMTMATVGYGDLAPTSDLSKLFTVFYTFLSIGSFVSLNAKCVQMMFDDHINTKRETGKRIKKMMHQFKEG